MSVHSPETGRPAGGDLAALSTVQFLSHLHGADVRLWAEGDRLRFSAPAGGLDAGLRAELARRKQEVLDFLRRSAVAGEELAPIAPVPRAGLLPTSFAQERLWFLDQLEPLSAAYTVSPAYRLRGRVHPGVLARSLREIVRRHEVLRTTFANAAGRPMQRIAPAPEVPLPVIDLTAVPAAGREPHALRLAQAMAEEPFDLARGPLLRVSLVLLAADEALFLLAIHHIVFDGWSSAVLTRELLALYAAYAADNAGNAGSPSPRPAGRALRGMPQGHPGRAAAANGGSGGLAELPIQYADYAAWQRRRLSGQALAAELGYWRRQLAGAPQVLELPADRPRPAGRGLRGAALAVDLGRGLGAALGALGRAEDATLYMVLLAGFQALLGRYTGQLDLLTGSGVAGRTRHELEGLIGFFVNTLVLRADLAGNPGFRELLGRARATALAAFAHQEVPFERLVEELQPERHLNRNPLFQAALGVQNAPTAAVRLPGLEVAPLERRAATAKFDLTLVLHETAGSVAGWIEYATDLFDAATARRMVEHFGVLLAAATADPETPLSALPLLAAAERAQLLTEWNATAREYPRAGALHDLVFAQARRTPRAPAVIADGASLSYGALAARARALAARLRAAGLVAETPVGLYLERSPEMVVGMLAILAAGGFYVPLDPGDPHERLAFLLADTGAAVLVTDERLEAQLPAGLAWVVLTVGGDEAAGASEPVEEAGEGDAAGAAERPEASEPAGSGIEEGGDRLAYVIYTSGSTGRPKGVAVPHRAVLRLVCNTDYVTLAAGQRMLQVAHASFDAATFEIWGPLLHGGTVVVLPERAALTPGELAASLRRHAVDTMFLTTSLFNQVVREDPEAFAPLGSLLVGGEALDPGAVRAVLATAPPRRLLNVYGPTENTTFSTWHLVREVAPGAATVPIGRPIANSRAHVLDAALRPLPAGVRGSLYLGGDGLARGYLGRPDLTAERFVPDPFAAADGAGEGAGGRLYATGDLARLRPDGAIEFLGRADHQVKIRGFRIELGEIERALAEHPAVAECVVLARDFGVNDRRLVACVVPAGGGPDGGRSAAGGAGQRAGQQIAPFATLREHLRRTLPDYMVPAHFLLLDALPLTANGKVDRRSLLQLEPARHGAPEPPAAPPQDPVEELVAHIWEEVLQRERVGRDESFFDLGGHSLLATQVILRLHAALAVELPIHELFDAPTVAALTRRVHAARGARAGLDQPVVPVPRGGDLPLSFGQQRMWVLHRFEPGSIAYNMPSTVRLRGPVDAAALAQALAGVMRRHEVLRTTYAAPGGRPVQVVAAVPRFRLARLPMVDLGRLAPALREAEARRLAAAEARRPFDLEAGPVLRTTLVRLAAQELWVLLTLHHIAGDAWSLGILVREVAAIYGALVRGEDPGLPALPVQYADYACWQQRYMQGEALAADLAHWRRALAGAPHGLSLLLDRPRPPVQTSRGRSVRVELPAELSAALARASRERGATLFMALLAGFGALLAGTCGQRDVLVGSPIAGRRRHEIEGLIGFFVNTLVLRLDLAADPSFEQLLTQARQVALDAYAHQDLPFERLVEEISPERDLSQSPLFQVMLALQNAPLGPLELPGATLEPLPIASGAAMFDLNLSLAETAGGIAGSLAYNVELFDAATVKRLAARFAALLAAALARPADPVLALPLLAAAERHQLAVEWNATAAPPSAACLHQLIARQAARTPAAPAVSCAGATLSYAQLDRRAGRLAERLRALGVGPEALVGICAERSLEMVLGMLAALQAGGAWLPLDPDHPAERLAFQLADARPAVVLVQPHLAGRLPRPQDAEGVRRLALGPEVWQEEAAEEVAPAAGAGPAAPAALPDHAAYVIYTSGSTGRPKAVVNTHRGIVNRLLWGQAAYGLAADDRVLQKTPFTFDVSVWEFFWPLTAGAQLVMARPGGHQDSAYLVEIIERERITTLHFVPSMLAAFLEERELGRCAGLRRVMASGEALPAELVRRFAARLGEPLGVELHNLYGPTEAAVEVTAWACGDGARPTVPIGRPIANLEVHVLDHRGETAPIGVAGELHIGGTGLARGYLARPELTAERFVPHPLAGRGPAAGARLYRTGDLARALPGGEIDFLGRLDHQVKVRGFRIELGEVEAVLARHPAVREAAVVAVDKPAPIGRQLVGFFTVTEGAAVPAAGELREWLGQSLPAYMVPAALVRRDRLPQTTSGKIDRGALGRLQVEWEEGSAFVAPRTGMELALQQIWEEVLQVHPIGVTESFFRIGGNSLLAIYIVVCIRERLGRELPVPALVQEPTIEGLAGLLERAPAERLFPSLVALQERGAKPPLFVVHGAGGNVFYYVELVRLFARIDPERPFYGLQARGLTTGEEPLLTVEEMAASYLEAIRSVQAHGPYHLGGYSMGGLVAYEVARRLEALGETVAFVAMFDGLANLREQLGSMDRAEVIAYFAGELQIPVAVSELHEIDPAAQLELVLRRGWELRRIPREFSLADAQRYFRVMETSFEAARGFAPGEPIAGRIAVFRSASMAQQPDPTLGWRARGGAEAHAVPGDHRTLFESPNVDRVGELLAGCLAGLDGVGGVGGAGGVAGVGGVAGAGSDAGLAAPAVLADLAGGTAGGVSRPELHDPGAANR